LLFGLPCVNVEFVFGNFLAVYIIKSLISKGMILTTISN
jgi:hypothetical protein